jgi:hypothetical protein
MSGVAVGFNPAQPAVAAVSDRRSPFRSAGFQPALFRISLPPGWRRYAVVRAENAHCSGTTDQSWREFGRAGWRVGPQGERCKVPPSDQLQESLQFQPRLFQDVRQCGSFDGSVSRDGDFEKFFPDSLLQAKAAAPLAHYGPAISLQGMHDLRVRQARHLAYNSTSLTSALSSATQSSSTGSR